MNKKLIISNFNLFSCLFSRSFFIIFIFIFSFNVTFAASTNYFKVILCSISYFGCSNYGNKNNYENNNTNLNLQEEIPENENDEKVNELLNTINFEESENFTEADVNEEENFVDDDEEEVDTTIGKLLEEATKKDEEKIEQATPTEITTPTFYDSMRKFLGLEPEQNQEIVDGEMEEGGHYDPYYDGSNAAKDVPSLSPLPEPNIDFSKLPPGNNALCDKNNGVDGNMSRINPKIQLDTTCLCIAFNKKIKMVSGFRNGDHRNHGKGLAIDIEENNFKNRQKDAMFVVMLIALKYNIGSYLPGFGSFHADEENSSKWKTWSGVAHTNYGGSNARNYYQQVQDALQMIGTPAVSARNFRSTYGNPSISQMSAKATAYVQANGSEAMKQCLAARI